MKFPKTCKIHKATRSIKDIGRFPAMAHVLFTGKELVATDGQILAIVPVTDVSPSETPGLIGVDAIEAVLKASKAQRAVDEATILANGKAEAPLAPGVPSFDRPEGGEAEFPRWAAVLPDRAGRVSIGIDVSLLAKLADALGGPELILSFDMSLPRACIRVDASSSGPAAGAYGAIMPFAVDFRPDPPVAPRPKD